jgi:hypothetical protein
MGALYFQYHLKKLLLAHAAYLKKHRSGFVPGLVLFACGHSYSGVFSHFVALDLFGTYVPPIFLDGSKFLGQAHTIWHGMFSSNKARTTYGKRQKLHVGGQPYQYVGHYVDAFGEQ